jgi:hypothetical protein
VLNDSCSKELVCRLSRFLGRLSGMILLLLVVGLLARAYAGTGLEAPLLFVQHPEMPAARAGLSLMDSYRDGYQIVRLDPDGSHKVLTEDFLSARDPAVSFNGRQILFAGKREAGDYWQIWRMNADGEGVEQITRGDAHSFSPLYIGALFHLDDKAPTSRIAYVSAAHGWKVSDHGGPVFSLYACNLNGGNPRRITFNLLSDFAPDVLDNGRLVFSSWRPASGKLGSRGQLALMAVNMDGTDLMPFAMPPNPDRHLQMVRVAPNGNRVYFIEAPRSAPWAGGDLAYVSRRRPLHSRVHLAADGGAYHSPCPLPDGRLLVSYRGLDSPFAIYEIDPETGQRQRVVWSDPGLHVFDTQVLASHPQVQGRSSIVGFRFKDSGVFYSLSVYISEHPEIAELPAGTIKQVRVIEGVAEKVAGEGKRQAGSRILGVAPVEEDGSFHLRVPAETPLAFQLLDAHGVALAGQDSWTWVMPGESRLCIGCHEDREMVPPNRLAQAILKLEVSLLPPVAERRSYDFERDVAPILVSACASCHHSKGPPPLLDGTPSSYRGLLQDAKPYLIPGSADRSPLIRRLLGRKKEEGTISPTTANSCRQELSEKELGRLIEWVDLGAFYNGRKDVGL